MSRANNMLTRQAACCVNSHYCLDAPAARGRWPVTCCLKVAQLVHSRFMGSDARCVCSLCAQDIRDLRQVLALLAELEETAEPPIESAAAIAVMA